MVLLLLLLSHHVPKTDPGMEKEKGGEKKRGLLLGCLTQTV